jgi:hypothetical protein
MKTRMMRKIAVLVTGSALALSLPVAGAVADSGGVPHPGSQGKGKQQKQNNNDKKCSDNALSHGKGTAKDKPNENGLKCGFEKVNGDLTAS